jgi:hypothetical protein
MIEPKSVFEEWEKSFPDEIPEGLRSVAELTAKFTVPNPNAYERLRADRRFG